MEIIHKSTDPIEEQIRAFVESLRPPEKMRDKVDIGFAYKDSVFELYSVRPMYNNKEKIIHTPVAKARFIQSKSVWKLYWMRASLKWELYEERGESHKELSDVLEIIKEDKYGVFWG